VSAQFKVNGLTIGQDEVDIMRRTTVVVFEVLERAWATRDCALIDMKIEFGVDSKGTLLLFASEVNYVVLFIQCDKYIHYSWC
jgi:phosphoribosylaminoimidazole carboxylase/phosphoribosylaminoimidazole-succinocarboxamide synthase